MPLSLVPCSGQDTWQDMKEMRDRMLKPQYLEAGTWRSSMLCEILLHGAPRWLLQTIGFQSFANFMEKKIEHMFADAINPVLDKLKELKAPPRNLRFASFLLVPLVFAVTQSRPSGPPRSKAWSLSTRRRTPTGARSVASHQDN